MSRKKISYIFLSLVLAATGLFSFVPLAFAKPSLSQATNYVIQLNSDNSFALTILGLTNIHSRFEFNTDAEFQNVYTFSSSQTLPDLRSQLGGKFNYLEIDQTLELDRTEARISVSTNDPGFTSSEFNIDKQWGLPKAQFTKAWAKYKGDKDVVVAIIDTGIDATHEDLQGQNFVEGYNIESDKPIELNTNSDSNGHGTLVAGIVGAVANNRRGITGGAWKVTLMPVRALDAYGSGSSAEISEAIVWAADHGASIINMSLGGVGFAHDTTLTKAISYAFRKDVVMIAAAGNDVAINGGNMNDNPVFPVCADNGENMIIGVTATDSSDVKPNFANFGQNCVDVSAPGRRILSTINRHPVTKQRAPDSYAYASGTSMAVPFVTAQAVLLRAAFPEANNRQIRDRIISTADNIDSLNKIQCAEGSCAGLLGSGRINVYKSLATEIDPLIDEGDVVKLNTTGQLFYINGAKRHAIFPFVYNQRFASTLPKVVTQGELDLFPEGSLAEPLDGTLIKSNTDSVVYYMSEGLKLPVTGQMFKLHGFSYDQVNTLSLVEVNSWITASFLAPPEGSLVRSTNFPTVYWVVSGVLHPINHEFYINRGLNIFPLIYVPDNDLKGFSKGEPYIL